MKSKNSQHDLDFAYADSFGGSPYPKKQVAMGGAGCFTEAIGSPPTQNTISQVSKSAAGLVKISFEVCTPTSLAAGASTSPYVFFMWGGVSNDRGKGSQTVAQGKYQADGFCIERVVMNWGADANTGGLAKNASFPPGGGSNNVSLSIVEEEGAGAYNIATNAIWTFAGDATVSGVKGNSSSGVTSTSLPYIIHPFTPITTPAPRSLAVILKNLHGSTAFTTGVYRFHVFGFEC